MAWGRATITSASMPIAARRSSVLSPCRPRPWSSRRSSNNFGRWRRECGSTFRWWTPCRAGSIRPPISKWRAKCWQKPERLVQGAMTRTTTTPKKIALQGEGGANSHIAIAEAYPDAEALPCPTFEDALAAIASGEASLGMIPIENSVAGRVADIHHLLPQSGLFIVGEYFLPIHHQLMAPRGAKLADIRSVESHVHALGQCRRIIRKLGIKPIVSGDTAGAARLIAERGDKACAAIASKLAAEIYGLDVLAEDIEDETHNTTRFVVLAREAKWAEPGSGPLVTTFVFRVRNLPAALYKAMACFATIGVNMTKLESYMIDGNFFATQFYADVDGHSEDKGLAFALEELKFFSREFRIVGVYPGHPFRATFSEKTE